VRQTRTPATTANGDGASLDDERGHWLAPPDVGQPRGKDWLEKMRSLFRNKHCGGRGEFLRKAERWSAPRLFDGRSMHENLLIFSSAHRLSDAPFTPIPAGSSLELASDILTDITPEASNDAVPGPAEKEARRRRTIGLVDAIQVSVTIMCEQHVDVKAHELIGREAIDFKPTPSRRRTYRVRSTAHGSFSQKRAQE
jgi:hypothetical protein